MPLDTPTTCEAFHYRADINWAKLPPGSTWHEVAAVATDRDDRVFVFPRSEHRVLIFAPDGRFLSSWGEGVFTRPHGITIHNDAVYCCDDLGHTVRKFTLDGRLLLTMGTSAKPSDTGATSLDYRTIVRAAGPFHYPTNLAVAPDGSLYISDGYGNARVHHFSADGRLLHSWGEPGSGPGQFNLPHGIAIDARGTVYVADRENSRVQLFTLEGRFITAWTDVARPCQVCVDRESQVWVAELGFKAGMWPGTTAPAGAPGGRLSVFDREGRLRARWGGGAKPAAAGDFYAPHDVCVDSAGNAYVAEVTRSAGGGPELHALQKFTRTSSCT
jgi:DNA-binding beta-propeller fold protein YncE